MGELREAKTFLKPSWFEVIDIYARKLLSIRGNLSHALDKPEIGKQSFDKALADSEHSYSERDLSTTCRFCDNGNK